MTSSTAAYGRPTSIVLSMRQGRALAGVDGRGVGRVTRVPPAGVPLAVAMLVTVPGVEVGLGHGVGGGAGDAEARGQAAVTGRSPARLVVADRERPLGSRCRVLVTR